MKITTKQLKQLIRETIEEMELSSNQNHQQLASIYSDVYKEKYGIRPRHMDYSKYSTEDLQTMIDDLDQKMSLVDYSHDEEMEDLIDQHGHEADEAERESMAAKKEDELMRTPEEGEEYPSHQGMGRRLTETFKKAILEALKDEGEPVGDQDELDVAPPFGKLDKYDFKRLGARSKDKAEKNKK
jgi:hypothetical protein